MRLSIFAMLPVVVTAFSWSPYDFGFHGLFPSLSYVSLEHTSPWVQVTTWDPRCASDGAVLLISPRGVYVPKPGPIILDARGNLVWAEDRFGEAMNFQVQHYKGEDYLTFWSGSSHNANSNGSYYMIDHSYEITHEVHAVGQGLDGDLHEFEVTDDGTALLTVYNNIEIDCSEIGIPRCWINDCLFQEVDIETGSLLFEWRSSEHIPLVDSYKGRGKAGEKEEEPYDYFHINSIEKDANGNYLVSSRHMHAIYLISGSTHETLWTIGGKHSNFTDLSGGQASNFRWQHHARWHENHTLSLFDNNGNNVFHARSEHSRGMIITVDQDNMTVKLENQYIHPDGLLAISQGSMQVRSNGNTLVGWGNTPVFTEFTHDGEVLCDMHFGPSIIFKLLDLGWVKSYRAFKTQWVGKPKSPPDIQVLGGKVFVSWNGATEVASWRLQSAESPHATSEEYVDIQELDKLGFETSFEFKGTEDYFVRAIALDKDGNILGYTRLVEWTPAPLLFSLSEVIIFMFGLAIAVALVWRYRDMLQKRFAKAFSGRDKSSRHSYELLDANER